MTLDDAGCVQTYGEVHILCLAIITSQTLFLLEKCLILVFNYDVLYSIM